MSVKVITGLDNLLGNSQLQNQITGNIGYLCHAASISDDYTHGIVKLQTLFGKRLKKIFGPQHGFVSDVQDNMIETDHYTHPYFDLPVYSLYSETRRPTKEMLEGLDSILVDLQDVGTRIYTYIYTLAYMMEECGRNGIKVFVLDRPNPVNGINIEGNILETEFKSFVGEFPLPVRHGMTIGEIARWFQDSQNIKCQLQIIPMLNWKRDYYFNQCSLPYVNPSPNLPTLEGCLNFPGSVLLEGTSLSEGRGTTRPLEMIGAPGIEPYYLQEKFKKELRHELLAPDSFTLRPIVFFPMFQKHKQLNCGGFFIHPINWNEFKPWKLYQALIFLFSKELKSFAWKEPPYEYEFKKTPMDLINGTDEIRILCEKEENLSLFLEKLSELEDRGKKEFLNTRNNALLY